MAESIAIYKGQDTSTWLQENISPVVFSRGKDLEGNKAAVEFLEDSRAIIHLSEDSDFSSWVHELGHILRRNLTADDLRVVEKTLDVKNGKWTKGKEEKFVKMLENYFTDEKFPEKAQGFLKKASEFMRNIYVRFVNKSLVPGEVAEIFDYVFSSLGFSERKQLEKFPNYSRIK